MDGCYMKKSLSFNNEKENPIVIVYSFVISD